MCRVNIVAATNNDALQALRKVNKPVIMQTPKVTSVEPNFAIWMDTDGLRRLSIMTSGPLMQISPSSPLGCSLKVSFLMILIYMSGSGAPTILSAKAFSGDKQTAPDPSVRP